MGYNYDNGNFVIIPPGNGAFIVKNSWGINSGEQGYFYISYYDPYFARYGTNTVFNNAEETGNYDNIYQYDPLGWIWEDGYYDTQAWGANVFTAEEDELLRAVSFYTTDYGTDYEIYIYLNPENGPISGNGPESTITDTFECSGYHTVALDSPIPLSAGQDYSVVIQFIATTWGWPVPIEYPLNEYSSKASANKGESYISHYGNDWEDITKRQGLEDTNICIKAFTDNPLNVDIPYDKMHFFENTNVKLVAETVDKDGRILDIASAADWQSSNATVGCVNPAGEFVATNEGTTVLTVNYGSFNDNMVMTVTDSEISDNKAIADRKYELRSQIFEGDTQGTVTCLTFPAFYQDTKTLQGTEKLSFLITETGNSAAINEGDLVNSTEIK